MRATPKTSAGASSTAWRPTPSSPLPPTPPPSSSAAPVAYTPSSSSSSTPSSTSTSASPSAFAPNAPIVAPAVWLYTLGVFQLVLYAGADGWADLTDPRVWGHGRAQDLVTLLLVNRRSLSRAEASATLWPDVESRHRGRLLRNALWNLRNALARHAVIHHADGLTVTSLALIETPYALALQVRASHMPDPPPAPAHADPTQPPASLRSSRPSPATLTPALPPASVGQVVGQVWCDVWAFEEATANAHEVEALRERLALGQEAVRLYRGPFLAHRRPERQRSSSSVGARQEAQAAHSADWTQTYRARAHAQWVRLVAEHATTLRRVGEREQALDLLLQALSQDALQVEIARRAMLLLAELNRPLEALDIYERCRRAYRDAYGGRAEPTPLKRLAADLRAGRILYTPRNPVDSAPRPTSGVYPLLKLPDRPDAAYGQCDADEVGGDASGWLDTPMTNPTPRRKR